MSVYQCKSGAHKGKWICKCKINGKWTTKYFGTKKEAKQGERERPVVESVVEPKEEAPEPKAYTLGELVALYFEKNERVWSTKKLIVYLLCGYNTKKNRHVYGAGEFLRDKIAEELNRKDLETLRQNLRESHQASNNSINHYQAHIRAVLSWAADQELIRFNPWQNFKRLPVKRNIVSVTYEDVRAVYESSPDWLQWAIKTAYCLCLRPGIVELFSLPWKAFDWRRGLVRVIQGKTKIPKAVVPPDSYMVEARQRYEADMAEGIDLVCTRHGKRVWAYHKAWDKACDEAGVKIRFYDVRHLAASTMLANGADLAAVAAQLGHQNVATTGKTYTHVMGSAQKKAGMALPSL